MKIASVSINDVLDNHCTGVSTLDAIEFLSEIEVILGRDTATQEVFLIYGRDRLDEISRNPDEAGEVDVILIEIARESDELNQLLALVFMAKERYDYAEVA